MSVPDGFRQLLSNDPAVARAVWRFNFLPAVDLHPSRRAALLPELPDQVWHSQRAQPRLSVLVLKRSGLRDTSCFDVPLRQWPLALLSVQRLERVARHVGALVLGVRVRASLARDHVLGWKARLGDDAYRFAMTSASLVPQAKLPLSGLVNEGPAEVGYQLIRAALSDTPGPMCQRVCLKTPIGTDAFAVETVQAGRLVDQVLRIVEAEWVSSLEKIRK